MTVVSPNLKAQKGFQGLCYYVFIHQKKYSVATTAQKMGCSIDTLYKKIRGERPFQFDDIILLTKATGDPIFVEYFCNPCGYMVIPCIKDKTTARMLTQVGKTFLSMTNGEKDAEKKS